MKKPVAALAAHNPVKTPSIICIIKVLKLFQHKSTRVTYIKCLNLLFELEKKSKFSEELNTL
jgi:hypothetical protein